MLNRMITRFLGLTCLLLTAAVAPVLGQGVTTQDYSGLDKYLDAGRLKNSSFVGVRAAEFLTIPVGARGIAMGSAYNSVADDISAIWWNPAGLGFLQNREAMFSIVDYTADITYSYAAFAMPVGDGNLVLGGFFGLLDVPDIEITTIATPNGTGSYYNAYDFQMGSSLACNLSDRFSAGLNLKLIHQDVLNSLSGNAFALDAGAIYHTEFADRELKFSFAVQNLGTNITMRGSLLRQSVGPQDLSGNYPTGYSDFSTDPTATSQRGNRVMYLETHTYRLPTVVKMSLSSNLYTSEKVNWLAAVEFWRPSNIPISYATGTELNCNFTSLLSGALRTGWMIQTDEYTEDRDQMDYDYLGDDPIWRGFSFGGGIQRKFGSTAIKFDYAYRNKGRLTPDNFVTISFGF